MKTLPDRKSEDKTKLSEHLIWVYVPQKVKFPKSHKVMCKTKFQRASNILFWPLTSNFSQRTSFSLSNNLPIQFLTFHNVCEYKLQHWCSQDYHLIHHKYVSIDGELLSEKMAIGNSILHHKRFTMPGFNTYVKSRSLTVFSGNPEPKSKCIRGEIYVWEWELTFNAFLDNKKRISALGVCILSP